MKPSRPFSVLLAFLLLFGQFSSMAHALGHLTEALVTDSHPSHGGLYSPHTVLPEQAHPASHTHQGHSAAWERRNRQYVAALPVTQQESIDCLTFHLHGSVHAVLPIKPHVTRHSVTSDAAVCRETTHIAAASNTRYDIRGPPDVI